MKNFTLYVLLCVLLGLTGGATADFNLAVANSEEHGATPEVNAASAPTSPSNAQLLENYGKLPLSFEMNKGQTDGRVKFLSRGQGYSLFLTPDEAVLSLQRADTGLQNESSAVNDASASQRFSVLRMKFAGANATPTVTGVEPLPGHSNYLIGKDAQHWRTDVANYAQVKYHSVYPGIDVLYYGNRGQLEYDFIVAPGADPSLIQISFQGAQQQTVTEQGDLMLRIGSGELKLHKPIIYQEIGGERQVIDGSYVVDAQRRVSFQLASYDTGKALIIDPVLSYATYLGGGSVDYGYGIAVDSAGSVYVTGQTLSANFPATVDGLDTTCGFDGTCTQGGTADAFISKLNDTGTALMYSTFLGGGDSDSGAAIAVDADASAYIAGTTVSSDFPVTAGAFDTTCGADGSCAGGFTSDAFVAKLAPAGNALVYSTFLGGDGFEGDLGLAMAVNASGQVFVAGNTSSDDFPTVNPYQAVNAGAEDAFVSKLSAAGDALLYSTYLGGVEADFARGIALDSSGNNAYIAGTTNSDTFPTTFGGFDRTFNSGLLTSLAPDAFVTKLGVGGNVLSYSTYLGGSGDDSARGIAVDGSGNAYVTGVTGSANFPLPLLPLPLQLLNGGGTDAFLTKLNPSGSALAYSTYLGGLGDDSGNSVALDGENSAYVAGSTESINFPGSLFAAPPQSTNGGGKDAFVSKFAPAGNLLLYSTYLGGNGDDAASAIAVESTGDAYITGETVSANFPTTPGAHDTSCGADANCDFGSPNPFLQGDGPVQATTPALPDAFVGKLTNPATAGTLQFSAANFSVNEETGVATVSVRRSGGISGAVSINYSTGGGTATPGSDYTATSGTITFANGDAANKTFTIPIAYNTAIEGNETINLALSNPTGGATLALNSAVMTIIDTVVTLQFNTAAYSVDESSGAATITVTRSGGQVGAASISYTTANGTAQSGLDYTPVSGVISFANGDATPKSFSIPISSDAIVEPNETINLTLSNPQGIASLGNPSAAVLTIENINTSVQFSSIGYDITEGNGNAIITVTRSGNSAQAVTVDYATSDGSAGATDYTIRSGTLNFAAGDLTPKTISIPITNDGQVEADETVNLTLSNPTGGATLGTPASTVLTIASDDVSVQFSAATYDVVENAGSAIITVIRNGSSEGAVAVNYATDGTIGSATAGSDYTARSGTISFANGDNTPKTFSVPILNDGAIEGDETVWVRLSNPTGGAVLSAPANTALTIASDDSALRLGLANYSVNEADGAAIITVMRTGSSIGAVGVSYTTSDDTAVAGSDYIASSGVINFADGDTEPKTFSVPIIDDAATEFTERVNLTLSAPTGGATLGTPATAVLTITSEDTTVQFSAGALSVNENAGTATLTVRRSGSTTNAISVAYATSDGTAQAGSDYTAKTGAISFAAGDNVSKTFTVALLNDSIVEPNETVNLTLSNPTGGAVLGVPAVLVLTLTNEDVSLQFNAASYSVNEGGTRIVTVTRSGSITAALTVNYATSNGSAVAGADYTGVSGTLSFPAGSALARSFSVVTLADSAVEANETVNLTLSGVTGGATLGGPATVPLTIVSSAGRLAFSTATYSSLEGIPSVTVTVTRTLGAAGAVSVDYASVNGTASAADYTGANGTLSFADGDATPKTFTLASLNDTLIEPNETVNLALSNPSGSATLGTSSAVWTLTNDDSTLQFSAASYSVNEGGTATVTVTRTGSNATAVTVNYATGNGSAVSGTDYTAASGTLTFGAGGATTKTFTVPTTADTAVEANETLALTLSTPTGEATLGMPSGATMTIASSAGKLAFSTANYSVSEADGVATITVARTLGANGPVAVNYATIIGGTAVIGTDYTSAGGTISFADGEFAPKTFTVPVINDNLIEGNKTANLTLSAPTGGATLGTPATAVLTITSEDTTVQFSIGALSVNENAGTATLTVRRSGSTANAISVAYATSDGTAQAGSDYTAKTGTISFAAGDNVSKTFTVALLNDNIVEPNETVNLTLSNPTGGAIVGTPATLALTLTNDDASLQFNATSYSVNEGGTRTVTVTRSGSITAALTVNYATSNGSAVAGADYTGVSGTLSFPAGSALARSFSVVTLADSAVEANETVNLTLSGVTGGATLGAPSTVPLTIVSSAGRLAFSTATYSSLEGVPSITVTVTRTLGAAGAISVDYASVNGTASAADYTGASGTLSFADGDATPKTFTLASLNDTLIESNETVNLALSNASGGATLGTSGAVWTITNDDSTLQFSAASYSVNEGGTATVTVTRTGSNATAVTVNYATGNGSAVSGTDYTAASGTLTFGAGGATTKTFTVPTTADTAVEANETLALTLSTPTGEATLGTLTGAMLTIVDNDVSLQFSAANYSVNEGAGSATITVTRIGSTTAAVAVNYNTSSGTALGTDYTITSGTLNFAAGDAAPKTFTVAITEDTRIESAETLTVKLNTAVGGATLGAPNTAVLTIIDND